MQRSVRFTLFTVAILALATFASAGDKAKLIEPELAIVQTGGLPGYANTGGPLTVEYEIHVYNPSSEAITLTRVNLQSISPVTSYSLRNESRPFDVTIAPGTTEVVTYRALVNTRGGMIGSQTPVNLKGVAYFDSEAGAFVKAFTHNITHKSQKTDG
jgi:hypothetical protein